MQLSQEVISVTLENLGALKEGGEIVWTPKRVKEFHETIEDDTEASKAEIKECKTLADLERLLLKGNGDGFEKVAPGEGNVTISPKDLKLANLKNDSPQGVAKIKALCDGVVVNDQFNSGNLDEDLRKPFLTVLKEISEIALKEIPQFHKFEGLLISEIKRDTRGKGDKKRDVFILSAYDPRGPEKNQIKSGEYTFDSLPHGLRPRIKRLENALLDIIKRERFVEKDEQTPLEGEQELLPVGGGQAGEMEDLD